MRSLAARIAEWRAAIARVRQVYEQAHGRPAQILAPVRYTEKIQWRKLFGLKPVFRILCDKLAVRDFIAARVGGAYHVPLLWSGAPADIPFEQLQPPYVIKSNHACAQVIMVDTHTKIDPALIRETAEAWLAKPYGVEQEEPAYAGIKPQVMVEQMLATAAGGAPEEHRFFVFGGKLGVIQRVSLENRQVRHGAFYRPDWTRLDWYFTRRLETDFPRPSRLGDMIRVAERLGRGFDHLRVDFYDAGDMFWVGELTLYPWSGHASFNPDEADFELGAMWQLPAPKWRAVVAMALRRRW